MNKRIFSERVYEKNKLWFMQLRPVFELMEKENIVYAIIKGQILSKIAYGKEGYRDSSDIDILISSEDINRVFEILEKNGFTQAVYDSYGNLREMTRKEKILIANSHQTVPYVKKISDNNCVNIDINVDLFWGEYEGERIDIKHILQKQTVYLDIYGMKVKTLNKLYNFIEVCLHHYKEMNAVYSFKYHNPFTTAMFEDIFRLFMKLSESEVSELISLCTKYSLNNFLYYVLYYTSKVFSEKRISLFCQKIKTIEAVDGLTMYGLCESERKEWMLPFESRMNVENIYKEILPFLERKEIKKANSVLSIFGGGKEDEII